MGGVKRTFRLFALWAVVTGVLMGVSFGAGFARGKGDAPAAQSGLTQQQIQQLINGGTSGGGQTGPGQQPGGGGPVLIGPGG